MPRMQCARLRFTGGSAHKPDIKHCPFGIVPLSAWMSTYRLWCGVPSLVPPTAEASHPPVNLRANALCSTLADLGIPCGFQR